MGKNYDRVYFFDRLKRKKDGEVRPSDAVVPSAEISPADTLVVNVEPNSESSKPEKKKTELNPNGADDFKEKGPDILQKIERGSQALDKVAGKAVWDGTKWVAVEGGKAVAEGARWAGGLLLNGARAVLNKNIVKWGAMTMAMAMLMLDTGGVTSFISSVLAEEVSLVSSWLPHIGTFLNDQVVIPVLQYAFGAPSWNQLGVLAAGGAIFYLKPWKRVQDLFKKK